jgi:ribosome-associated protein
MQVEELTKLALEALDDLKAQDVQVIDVREQSNVTDTMIVATGTSKRHTSSLAMNVATKAKEAELPSYEMEGQDTGEWVLVDLGDVVVHVLTQETRDFYQLERLWNAPAASDNSVTG